MLLFALVSKSQEGNFYFHSHAVVVGADLRFACAVHNGLSVSCDAACC